MFILNFRHCFAYKTSKGCYYPRINYRIFLYLMYRFEPETNITTLCLLGFHICEEKQSGKIGGKNKNAIKDRAVLKRE